jgi:hypothetical protein
MGYRGCSGHTKLHRNRGIFAFRRKGRDRVQARSRSTSISVVAETANGSGTASGSCAIMARLLRVKSLRTLVFKRCLTKLHLHGVPVIHRDATQTAAYREHPATRGSASANWGLPSVFLSSDPCSVLWTNWLRVSPSTRHLTSLRKLGKSSVIGASDRRLGIRFGSVAGQAGCQLMPSCFLPANHARRNTWSR